jgi:hypothetical protein
MKVIKETLKAWDGYKRMLIKLNNGSIKYICSGDHLSINHNHFKIVYENDTIEKVYYKDFKYMKPEKIIFKK